MPIPYENRSVVLKSAKVRLTFPSPLASTEPGAGTMETLKLRHDRKISKLYW